MPFSYQEVIIGYLQVNYGESKQRKANSLGTILFHTCINLGIVMSFYECYL
jgi:hypothetical protein